MTIAPTRKGSLTRFCRWIKVFLLVNITLATFTLVYLGNTPCFRNDTLCSVDVDVHKQSSELQDSAVFVRRNSSYKYGTVRPLFSKSYRSGNYVRAAISQAKGNVDVDVDEIREAVFSRDYVYADNAATKSYSDDSENCTKRIPDALIIGVQKCGTTALAKFLGTHPEVALRTQQSYFFTSNYFRGTDWYLDFLPCSTSERHVVIERTPQYFYSNRAPRRIKKLNKDTKLILIVCEPVRRLLSNVAMAKHRHRESESHDVDDVLFIPSRDNESAVDATNKYVKKSMYHLYIKQWFHEFSPTEVLILDGDAFAKHPLAELQKVEEFLRIRSYFNAHTFIINADTGFHCINTQRLDADGSFSTSANIPSAKECLPKSKGNHNRYNDSDKVNVLKQFFRDKNAAFYKLVNRTFDW